jgi:hypothetical protein
MTDVRQTLGYKAHTRARSTGTLVLLCDSKAQGIDPADGGKYFLICEGLPDEVHGGCLNVEDSQTARHLLRHPEIWCPYC